MANVIINADDFGLTDGICYGILDAYLKHSISAFSFIVNGDSAELGAELIRHYDISDAGVHLNVTFGKPLSDPDEIPSLIDETKCFNKRLSFPAMNFNEDELIKEFDKQIERFVELTGRQPSHINIHHKFDFLSQYSKLRNHLITKYQLPMRFEVYHDGYTYPKFEKVEMFMNDEFTIETCQDFIEHDLHSPYVEIPVHVGFPDATLMRISSLNLGRMKDLEIVNSKEFKDALKNKGYEMITWKDLERQQ